VAVLAHSEEEAPALAVYQRERDSCLRAVFDITCELSLFPPAARFVELQKQLGDAIEAEAEYLAARPSRTQAALAS
jgi:hypothetical protein